MEKVSTQNFCRSFSSSNCSELKFVQLKVRKYFVVGAGSYDYIIKNKMSIAVLLLYENWYICTTNEFAKYRAVDKEISPTEVTCRSVSQLVKG